MNGHEIGDHSLIHDRMHGSTIHEDMHKKNIHNDMHIGHSHGLGSGSAFGHSKRKSGLDK